MNAMKKRELGWTLFHIAFGIALIVELIRLFIRAEH
jgi:hypothetical protein